MSTQDDTRREVTARIVAALEAGTPPWRRPWRADVTNAGAAANASSGMSYRGVNALLLGLAGYESRWWATYAQVQALGGRVRKGEHGTRIVFWKQIEKETVFIVDGVEAVETVPLLKTYSVFNVTQVDGLEEFQARPRDATPFVDFAPAEAVLATSCADIRYGGSKAVYVSSGDYIRLPEPEAFAAPHEFYATAFHELIHWTGHDSRLDRLGKNARFGSTAYAREELVAEIGGCFLSAEVGVPQSGDLSNHAAYLNSWLSILSADPSAIFAAAGQASAAVDFLLPCGSRPRGPTTPAVAAA